jgi:protoporphyrinogen oxidase
MEKVEILIIGGGMAGLTAATYLKQAGIQDFMIIEKEERIGGKLRTDKVDGFTLDHGFQIFLSAYPEAQAILDYDALRLKSFERGAIIFRAGKKIPFYDPAKGIPAIWDTLFNGPITIGDSFRLLGLRRVLKRKSLTEIFNDQKKQTTLEFLNSYGFSQQLIDTFWVPFYQGIYLENDLSTDARMFQFTFKMFIEGKATIPEQGIEAIPLQLGERIGAEHIRLSRCVDAVEGKIANIRNGAQIEAERIIFATDAGRFPQLLEKSETAYWPVTNFYYQIDGLPFRSHYVNLNANPDRRINNFSFLSAISPQHSPQGKNLISVSANGMHGEDEPEISRELSRLLGVHDEDLRLINYYEIHRALPKVVIHHNMNPRLGNGYYRCGDYTLNGSLNAAMRSGRLAAEAVMEDKVN